MALRFVSLNIEGGKHLHTVVPFLQAQQPEVLCLQEVREMDLGTLAEAAGTKYVEFSPMLRFDGHVRGIALMSVHPLTNVREAYYHGSREVIREFDKKDQRGTEAFVLLLGTIEHADGKYRIGTTHFVWTPRGEADAFQHEALEKLLALLSEEQSFVLAGDFNAPRGGEIEEEIEQHYTNTIPNAYATSIDAHLHRSGALRPHDFDDKMVDHLFLTKDYTAGEVELVSGVSDHMAIVAALGKTPS